ncbi:MAG: hypothetical protein JST92_10085, partial [Deltaproteobacteria bacterium]|nr:hypothetical protein [Deltaproteobacteria bacterium]
GPTKLAFSTNVQTIATNACSGAVQVQTRDATNTAIAPNNPVTVSVSASNGALLYSNPACTVALGNLSIDTSGTTSSAFYFKSAAAATITLTASASGLTTATQQEVVSAPASGGATKLEFTGVASKYKLGDTLSFSVELADESDTVITAATNTITIALSATNGATLSGTTSKSATNGVATFSLTVDREGTGYQLQAFATPALADGTALSNTFEVAAGQLAFLGTGTLGSVGVCSGPVQLQVKDPTGTSVISPSNNIPVTFSTSGGLTIYADAACSSQYTGTLVVAAGSASTPIYFIAPAAGTQSITVSAPGYGTANVDVQATTGGGGGQPDGGGGGGGTADGGSDGGDDLAAHRTINGFACSSSGAVPDLGLTLLLCAMAMLHWRRRASVTRRPAAQGRSLLGQVTIAALVLAALPARAAEPQKAAAEAQKPADAPQQPMIAVLNFNTKLQGADKAEMDIVYLAAAVRRQVLRQVHDVNMMSPESMQTLVEAAGKSLAECEGQCEVQTGRLVNADLVVSGDLLKFGSSYTLALRMHDTHSAKQIGAAETRGKDADELLAGLGAAVAELFKVILAEQSAKENAAARRDAQAQREAEARALAKAQADEQEARRKERQRSEAEDDARMRRAAEIQAQAEARAHHGGIGIFGGVVWDPKAKTMGEEAGLSLHLGLGWSAQGSAIIAPHIGGRLSLLKGLVGGEDFGLQFGLRGAVVPLPDGTAFGGGAGLRLSWYPIDHVSMFAWFAGEAYKAGTETIFAPLLSLGLQLSL